VSTFFASHRKKGKKMSTTQRRNRACKIAYFSDIQRIFYAVSLTAFVHRWAWKVLEILIPSAITALQFLAALNRSSQKGYIGTAVAYSLLAPQISLATQRKCSPRTLQRGLAFLRAIGLVSLRYWTMPDQTIELGSGRTIRLAGTGRVNIGNDEWRSLQIRIVVLTDRALALWDRATKGSGKLVVPPILTSAKLADRSKDDSCCKQQRVGRATSDDESVSSLSEILFPIVRSVEDPSNVQSSNGQEGMSTRPEQPKAVAQTIEHQALTTAIAAEPTQTEVPPIAPNGASPAIAADQTQTYGCSRPKPVKPTGKIPPKSWTANRALILWELWTALERFSTREADHIFSRAIWELSRDYPAHWPTIVPWAYWIGRFSDFSPAQRRYHTMRDILPLLKSRAVPTPCERHLPPSSNPDLTKPSDNSTPNGGLHPFLADLLSRVVEKFEK
jgi:hypothetical protein